MKNNEEKNSFIENEIKSQRYFQNALSDFTFDAAGGQAIRHLVNTGYTAEQILHQLDYPVPMTKIRQTITKYLLENGTLRKELPVVQKHLQHVYYDFMNESSIFSFLSKRIEQDEEVNSYISCPFGINTTDAESLLSKMSLFLTKREMEYLSGIIWEPQIMYHRLNRRMLEIGIQLAINSDLFSFYFTKSCEVIHANMIL